MTTYDTVYVEIECPICSKKSEQDIQFAYGSCGFEDVKVGHKIVWGGRDQHGTPGHRKVIALGTGSCVNCDSEPRFAVVIENDVITGVHQITDEEFDAIEDNPEGYFIVVEP